MGKVKTLEFSFEDAVFASQRIARIGMAVKRWMHASEVPECLLNSS
jgi:hypothetical protein